MFVLQIVKLTQQTFDTFLLYYPNSQGQLQAVSRTTLQLAEVTFQ